MPRIGIRLTVTVCVLMSPALHADPRCVLAPGVEEILEQGPVSGWSCEPLRVAGQESVDGQTSKADDEILRNVGKWKLTLLDVGTRNRTRVSLNHKGLRLKVML